MIGAGAAQFLPLARFANMDALLQLFSGGEAVRGRVVSDGGGLAVALPNLRITLPPAAQLSPGTPVDVRLVNQEGVQKLHVQPRPETSAAPPASVPPSATAATTLLGRIVSSLSTTITPDQAAALVPNPASLPGQTIHALLEVLVGSERIGAQFARVASLVDAAVASGQLPAALGDRVRSIARRMQADSVEEFLRLVVAARESLRGQPAGTLGTRPNANRSLLAELLSLRAELDAGPASRRDVVDAIVKSMDALIERIDAGRLPNVRSFEAPYQFLDIPLARQTGFDRAQIHIFGEESRANTQDPKEHLVVFDLDLSRLGSLWIVVQARGSGCACTIRASAESARGALEHAAPDLEAALRSAGYAGASVRAEPWDGDRVTALAGMMGRLSGFDAKA